MFDCTCRKLITNGIEHPTFNDDNVNQVHTFIYDPGNLIGRLKLILKDFQFD